MKTEIPSTEDLLFETPSDVYAEGEVYSESGWSYDLVKELMIKYAKLHLQAQKEAILANAKVKPNWVTKGGDSKVLGSYTHRLEGYIVDEESINNAYNIEENVK